MPRRTFEDDEQPARTRRRSRFDEDDDFDDRPRPRSRRDDDDEFDRPPRKAQSNALPWVLGGLGVGLVVLLIAVGVLSYALRARPAANPPAQANFGPPGPMAGGPPPVPNAMGFAPPQIKDALPPEAVGECTISNLRLSNGGFGGRGLAFEYDFPQGLQIAERYVAVVQSPGQQAATADLHLFGNAKGSVTVSMIGGFGNDYPRGTQVYIGKGFAFGPNQFPKRISNTLVLP
jgi:hypothetical protein